MPEVLCPKGHGCCQCAREERQRRAAEEGKDADGPMIVFFGLLLMAIVLAGTLLLFVPGYAGEGYGENPFGWRMAWVIGFGLGPGLVGLGLFMNFRRRVAQRRRSRTGAVGAED